MNTGKLHVHAKQCALIGRQGLATALCLLAASIASAQLVVTNNAPYDSTQYLIDNVFSGSGVTISNIQYSGSPGAIGFFDGTSSNLGLDSGLVLSTGDISILPGPNDTSSATLNAAGCPCPGDSLLESMVLDTFYTTFDAAILKFDFSPAANTILFTYVFGSEEYWEFVFSPWNDVMGMFLTGPNPAGGTYDNQNIALVPNAAIPVSTNNVNDLVNTAYYVDNDPLSAVPPAGQTVQLDGFTTPLEATADVVCGATYTLIIGIADGSDAQWDSGLFLKAESFGSQGGSGLSAATSYYTSTSDSALLEGCGYAEIEVIRSGDISDSLQVAIEYAGPATNGNDYALLPDTITFPQNIGSYNLQVNPASDTLSEGDEELYISFTPVLSDSIDSVCFSGLTPSLQLTIRDREPMELSVAADVYLDCPGDTAFIFAAVTGAYGGAVLSWSTGLIDSGNIDTSSFFDAPNTTTIYVVTAIDSCGTQILADTITVFAPDFPPLEVNLDDTAVCLGGSLLLTPLVTGGNGEYSYNWSTGDTASSLYLTPGADSVYSVVVTDACGATITAQSLVGINPQPIADFSFTMTESSEAILTNTSTGGVTYFWDFGDGSSSSVENPTHAYSQSGLHSITLYVYNQYNCLDSVSYTVDIITKLQFYVPNVLDLNSLNQDNNRLYVFGEGIETLSFSIYDRWGEIVYQTSDASTSLRGDGLCCAYGEGWDGTYNNAKKTLNTSVFAYIVTGTFINGEEFMESGSITLIK